MIGNFLNFHLFYKVYHLWFEAFFAANVTGQFSQGSFHWSMLFLPQFLNRDRKVTCMSKSPAATVLTQQENKLLQIKAKVFCDKLGTPFFFQKAKLKENRGRPTIIFFPVPVCHIFQKLTLRTKIVLPLNMSSLDIPYFGQLVFNTCSFISKKNLTDQAFPLWDTSTHFCVPVYSPGFTVPVSRCLLLNLCWRKQNQVVHLTWFFWNGL